MSKQNPNHEYLVEFATGQSVGLFRVGERAFHARALTVAEGMPFQQLGEKSDSDLVEPFARVLDARKSDGAKITKEWVANTMTGTDLFRLLVFLTNPASKAPAEPDAVGGDLPN